MVQVTEPHVEAPPKAFRPIVAWSSVGVAVVVINLYLFTAWFASGDAHAVGTGADKVPTLTWVFVISFQITAVCGALWAISHAVRTSRAQGRLSFDAMLVIAWTLTWWHDPIISVLRPTLFYNAANVNLGSWTPQIPGWISPNAQYMPEPIIGIGVLYISLALGFGILGCKVMEFARGRWTRLGPVGLLSVAFLAILVVEFSTELLASLTHLVAYPSSISWMTLFAGTTHQLPVYEQVLWSLVLTATAGLRFFTSPDGRSVAERGIDRLHVGHKARSLVALLAITGFVNVTCVTYDVVMNVTSLYAGHVDLYPTYLRTQQCGPGTGIPCPGPGVPIIPGGK